MKLCGPTVRSEGGNGQEVPGVRPSREPLSQPCNQTHAPSGSPTLPTRPRSPGRASSPQQGPCSDSSDSDRMRCRQNQVRAPVPLWASDFLPQSRTLHPEAAQHGGHASREARVSAPQRIGASSTQLETTQSPVTKNDHGTTADMNDRQPIPSHLWTH